MLPHNFFGIPQIPSLGVGSQEQQNQLQQNMKKKSQKIQAAQAAISSQLSNKKSRDISFLQILMEQSKITYIDSQKQYVVVRAEYFHQLEKISQKNKHNQLLLSTQSLKNNNEQQVTRWKQQKLRQLLFKQGKSGSQVFEYNNQQADHQITGLKQTINAYKQQLQKQVNNLNIALGQHQNLQIKYKQVVQRLQHQNKQSKPAYCRDVDMQTQYQIKQHQWNKQVQGSILGQQDIKQMGEQERFKDRATKTQKQIDMLKERFKTVVDSLEQEIKQKIQQLQTNSLMLDKCQKQNRRLKSENISLKSQIHQIDQKKKMSELWRQKITSFLFKMEDEVSQGRPISQTMQQQAYQPDNIMLSEQSSFNEYGAGQTIKILQKKVLTLLQEKINQQMKIKQIGKILAVNQEDIAEEGIIANMVKLSSKAKQSIRYLLEEI